jgi:D-alanyl-D-alanine carboxypeptidase/D-alanyl-D-alanine-endopeptidase (penicillin-binding protein 4)
MATLALEPVFEAASPTLAEIIRDINKHSNNVMAQQLFLTLSLPVRPQTGSLAGALTLADGSNALAPAASRAASRALLQRWWAQRIGSDDAPVLDNGAGLSRNERISAQALAQLLQTAYRSPLMPELMASLPIAGVDGTLKRSQSLAAGRAHLKSGSLRDVAAIAGYVLGASGKRYVLVAIANHPNAGAVRGAFDTLLDWVVNDN